MSLKNTHHTQHFKSIPKKCKNCAKAIYTIEQSEVYYHCSIYGKFKRECDLEVSTRTLLKSEEILNKENS